MLFKAEGSLPCGRALVKTNEEHHKKFLDFLKQLVKSYPEPELHFIVDNLSARKHKNVRTWLEKHPRVKNHDKVK